MTIKDRYGTRMMCVSAPSSSTIDKLIDYNLQINAIIFHNK